MLIFILILNKSLHPISFTSFFCPIPQLHYNKSCQMLSILSVSKSFFIFAFYNPFRRDLATTFLSKLLVKVTNYHHVAKSNDKFLVLILTHQQLLTVWSLSAGILSLLGLHIFPMMLRIFFQPQQLLLSSLCWLLLLSQSS